MTSKYIYRVTQGCTLCGMCLPECAQGAISMGKRGSIIDPKKCVGCGKCANNCASEAIVRTKREDEII